MGPEWLVRAVGDLWPEPRLPAVLEPVAGASQCGHELIRALAHYANRYGLRYTIGAGTLLGAMRNSPGGMLQWEHDVDVYMPARDASRLRDLLTDDCNHKTWRSRWCGVLHFPGLVDRAHKPCCTWGFKVYHQHTTSCELDVLVLAAAQAPFMHGESWYWPIWGLAFAAPYYWASAWWQRAHRGGEAQTFYVIPQDVVRGSLMSDDSRWCRPAPRANADGTHTEWIWCGAPPLSFFQDEYFAAGELFPTGHRRFGGVRVRVPRAPWAVLNRTYGDDCAYMARLNEFSGARADLRRPENARLLAPAKVEQLPWWRVTSRRWRSG